MVRKGAAGVAREDGMTEEVSQHLRTVGSRICQDETALEWLYSGGPSPDAKLRTLIKIPDAKGR